MIQLQVDRGREVFTTLPITDKARVQNLIQ